MKTRFAASPIEACSLPDAGAEEVHVVEVQARGSAQVEVIVYDERSAADRTGGNASTRDDGRAALDKSSIEGDRRFAQKVQSIGCANDRADPQTKASHAAPRREAVREDEMSKAVFCIATNLVQAESIVEQLEDAGFSNHDISVLYPDQSGTRDFAHQHSTKAPEGATAGAGTGGALGGALGWLVGAGSLAIPGAGLFIAAGPILAALSGVAVGGAVGGVTGALVGMGIPEFEATRYEGKVYGGNILISVHTEDSDERSRAKEIFKRAKADHISSSSESSAKGR